MKYKIKIQYNIDGNVKYATFIVVSETLNDTITIAETNFNKRFGTKGTVIISSSQEN